MGTGLNIAALLATASEAAAEAPAGGGGVPGAIIIRTPSAETKTFSTDEPVKISKAMSELNLTVSATVEYWVSGNKVPVDYVVSPGTTVTIIGGSVKGG